MSKYFTLMLASAMMSGSPTFAATPTSTNYALPSSAVNNGVADLASANFKLSSSVGDMAYTMRSTSTGFVLSPGFWHATIGVTQGCVLDVDGNNSITAMTDGLMLLRVMLGLTDDAVINGATVSGAPRTTWAQIQPFVHLAALDIDGNGSTLPASDGVMLLRAMFGLTGTAVTNGAVVGSRTWAEIRTYLNTNCGGNFAL
ncbi:MAG: hypothetical protein ABIZ64_03860 [Casimicrobium sp.]